MSKDDAQAALQDSTATPITNETRDERVRRLYSHQGGPLIGWLWDEARRRGLELQEMAAELGVTYGYLNQLRNGIRKTAQISHDFAAACAEFLGVPTVVVLLLAGYLTMRDFSTRAQSEEDMVQGALRQMLDDPHFRATVPVDPTGLSMDAKRALVQLYADATGRDVFNLQGLPSIVRWLQRAAELHDENEGEVARGHRDVGDRDTCEN